MSIILQIVITYSLFFSFVVMVSILGVVVLKIVKPLIKLKDELFHVRYFYIFFLVGLILYLTWGYVSIFFNSFNFYTIYLPLLVNSSIYIVIKFLKGHPIDKKLKQMRLFVKNNRNNLLQILLIFISIIILQFLLMGPILFQNISLLSKDPYYWTKSVLFLKQNGFINTARQGGGYPLGFNLFCGACTLISPDFITTYYFMKLGGLPFLTLYLILIFIVLKKVIKNKGILFLSLVLCISNVYFMYRITMFLSSSLSVLLILIGTLIFITPEIHNYLLGFVLAGSFLFNPVYTLFFIITLLIFYGIEFFKKKGMRKDIFKEILFLGIIALGSLVSYFLSLGLIFNTNLLSVIMNYIRLVNLPGKVQTIFSVNLEVINETFSINIPQLISDILYYGLLHVVPIFLVMMKFRIDQTENKQVKTDFKLFLQITVILIPIVLVITSFLTLNTFFEIFFLRIVEGFNVFIVVALGLVFSRFYSKLISFKAKFRFNLSNKQVKAAMRVFPKNSWKAISMVILFLFTFLAYTYAYNNFIYIYLYDDSMTNCVFYIQQNYEPNTKVGTYEINTTSHDVYDLLFDYDLYFYNQFDHWTFEDFWNYTQVNSLQAVIIKLDFFNATFIEKFYNESSFEQVAGGKNLVDYQLFEIL